jgi:hypothetical protein
MALTQATSAGQLAGKTDCVSEDDFATCFADYGLMKWPILLGELRCLDTGSLLKHRDIW